MQIKNLAALVAAAALSSTTVADFVIITKIPTPTAIPDNIQSYISSLENFVTSKIGELTASLGTSAVSEAASAHTALESFVKTASYSIPSDVTDIGALETFTTVPDWYSALPSDVKSYYDANNAKVQSLLNEAILGANATTTGASVSGSKTGSATGSAATAQSTGGAAPSSVAKVVGAGVAAAFVGVLAL
ncbi:hypothetical protein N0V83_003434 [Neocucurbitaria cava]|uniref:Uncharacterized protein n=1 Tax=Neocucurbitaria cava TaxID=798079 RepID=A0A9W8YB49_9PLEO|nr:hypothetical protein N0V83_003434 [Neocucurbitaria cava]